MAVSLHASVLFKGGTCVLLEFVLMDNIPVIVGKKNVPTELRVAE